MLSRVAERIYWLARYLERAENGARLVNAYTHLLLDLPREAGLGWGRLIDITGNAPQFRAIHRRAEERNTLRFVVADTAQSGSILSCLSAARENMRTSRDIVPTEGWECVNELYLYGREQLRRAVFHRRRHEVLSEIIARCQLVTGLLDGTMSHGDAYQFLDGGRQLERADMTTRILDMGAATLLRNRKDLARYENTLWMNVLQSLSAYQMYRQYVRRRILPEDVTAYLLKDERFPRAFHHCLNALDGCLSVLPRSESPRVNIARLRRLVDGADVAALVESGLHEFIDDLQRELIEVHGQIATTWFLPPVEP